MYQVNYKQFYAEGEFATIYKVSPHRIIKAFNKVDMYTNEEVDFLISDEINGSKLNYGLPVIKEVEILTLTCHCGDCNDTKTARGLLKRFVPNLVSEKECIELVNRPDFPIELKWDSQDVRQMRKDEKGRIYVIDTQTEKIMHLIGRGRER